MPNTLYGIFFTSRNKLTLYQKVTWTRGCYSIFLLRQKYQQQKNCPKSDLRAWKLYSDTVLSLRKLNVLIFFYKGTSATKSKEKSRIFRYGLPEDFLTKYKRGGGRKEPLPPCMNGLIKTHKKIPLATHPIGLF